MRLCRLPITYKVLQLSISVFYEDSEQYYSTTFFNESLTFSKGALVVNLDMDGADGTQLCALYPCTRFTCFV